MFAGTGREGTTLKKRRAGTKMHVITSTISTRLTEIGAVILVVALG
jgi:hypothetical protein